MTRHPLPSPAVARLALLSFVALVPASGALALQDSPSVVVVGGDNTEVTASCTLSPNGFPVEDADGNGVVHIKGRSDGKRIVVDLGGARLIGGIGAPESLTGAGIVVTGKNVTLRNGSIQGYKVAIRAQDCDGLILEDLDTSDNYAQVLRSKPWGEEPSDWLFPQSNDAGEWIAQHGAGIAVRDARDVVVRRVKNQRTQNGIVLDRVTNSQIYDNDCSFLSGWGIALWRSSGNTICRNSVDFCVRGYSHGVYNRGQDSAGILMFEQCSQNIVALNSATHCGDGVFGFAGRESLGEAPKAGAASDWYKGRGSNGNLFLSNDLSYSAAHGLEITFSFGNVIARNRFDANAICGVWAGYSRDTVIVGNTFNANGRVMTGSERGGINMEHAKGTLIHGNSFSDEPVSVRFWTDADEAFAKLPWAKANGMGAASNAIAANSFKGVGTAVELVAAKDTLFAGNTVEGAKSAISDQGSSGTKEESAAPARTGMTDAEIDAVLAKLPGERKAVGMRDQLKGRDKIVMLDRAPYAWDRPVIVQTSWGMEFENYKVYNFPDLKALQILGSGPLFCGRDADGVSVSVTSNQRGFVGPYLLQVLGPGAMKLSAQGLIAPGDWATKFFTLEGTGVPEKAAFAKLAVAQERNIVLPEIDFDFQGKAPKDAVRSPDASSITVGADRFGVSTSANMRILPGRYRVCVLADDGVRVSMDGKAVIDRWSARSAPAVETFEFELTEMREIIFDVEYFQDKGPSRLRLWFEAINPKFFGA
jgi:parallel beta-helix repeat protein